MAQRDTIFLRRCYVHHGAHEEKRKRIGLAMPTLVMDASAYLMLYRFDSYHARWNFITGRTATLHIRRPNARMHAVGLDLAELPHSR